MKAYSLEFRQRVVGAVDESCTAEEAAALFDISIATVRRYLRQRRLEGALTPKTSPGRPRLIKTGDEAALRAQVMAHPDHHLDEHCLLWQEQTAQVVGVATMCRAMARLKLLRKKRQSTHRNKMPKSEQPGRQR